MLLFYFELKTAERLTTEDFAEWLDLNTLFSKSARGKRMRRNPRREQQVFFAEAGERFWEMLKAKKYLPQPKAERIVKGADINNVDIEDIVMENEN